MPRTPLTIDAPDGACSATLHTPDGAGPWPGVVMFVDAGGVRDTFLAMADHLASLGYAVLLPDVYYRHGGFAPFDMDTVFADPEERARLMGMVKSLTSDFVAADAAAYAQALLARPEVAGPAVGTTGYCMGGKASLTAAGALGATVGAAASFHGGGLAVADDPGSPHHRAGGIAAAVYVAGAKDDGSFGPEQFALLDETLTDAGVRHTIETYPAAHGFAVPDNPTHDQESEDRHWAALVDLYRAAL
ncbi:dienelactone hydrolase family protein [Pseudonocardia sp. WMMC193]|uniref:dienelactone hydrolase family protein n=1 Tax=Pseudonocardia sp. WMMC193 TaxID=2911965 RepID=UPI001F39E276|nr:dienelactone hydrolase family protein [Pseudonocardia sp. WMMC193]MCF7548769.1 dienelactone hydrolase family protein [Pseudonocardia sp. WMMC193]